MTVVNKTPRTVELLSPMNLFSKLCTGDKTDALVYDLPQPLRVQIYRLWEKGFGPDERYHPGPGMAYQKIYETLCDEHGVPALPQVSPVRLPLRGNIAEYFLNFTDTEKALDVVQVVFSTMETMLHRPLVLSGCIEDPFGLSEYQSHEIIDELNRRFTEHSVGYRYFQGRIEKIASTPDPMPLKERLVAGEPARNLRKIRDMIGASTVTAIHDPYTSTGSLDTVLKLAGLGAKFSPSLRILGTAKPLSNATEKKSLVSFLRDINNERKATWAVRLCPATSKPHRRFMILHDGSVVTCGMSLNHIDKDEVLDHEPSGSENARHDVQLFEHEWKAAASL